MCFINLYMVKSKTRYLNINVGQRSFLSKLIGGKEQYDFSDIAVLRQLLTNEKAKILYTLKTQNPPSIYGLAKILDRDFKAVWKDLKSLEKFGFIEFLEEKKGKRIMLKPTLAVNQMQIVLDI